MSAREFSKQGQVETRRMPSGHQRRAVNSTGSGREERGPWRPCSSEQAAQIRAEAV